MYEIVVMLLVSRRYFFSILGQKLSYIFVNPDTMVIWKSIDLKFGVCMLSRRICDPYIYTNMKYLKSV